MALVQSTINKQLHDDDDDHRQGGLFGGTQQVGPVIRERTEGRANAKGEDYGQPLTLPIPKARKPKASPAKKDDPRETRTSLDGGGSVVGFTFDTDVPDAKGDAAGEPGGSNKGPSSLQHNTEAGAHISTGGQATTTVAKPGKDPFRFNPRSKFFRNWDVLIALLLIYTAIFTPVEVGFFESKLNGLFFINRFVDLSFVMDMCFNFVLPVQNDQGVWVTSERAIAQLYLRSWFTIDLISVLPFDVVGVVSDSSTTSNLKVLRIIRLFRLAKLLRLLRSGRMFQRWESTLAINYAKMSLMKFVMITLAVAHWLACAFHLITTIEDVEPNWITNYPPLDMDDGKGAKYLTALYWAVATLSTLGYGDVIPVTHLERGFVVFCAMLGASVYAFMVGNVCSIIQGMDENNSKFNHMMDTLNVFMEEKNMPQEIRVRLRDFFRFRKSNSVVADWHSLLADMSPALQNEVTNHLHSKWIRKVSCFANAGPAFITHLALKLKTDTFSARETVVEVGSRATAMWIMERGVAAKEGKVISSGKFFGEDMVLNAYSDHVSVRPYMVKTLTNSVMLVLKLGDYKAVVAEHPSEQRMLRAYVTKEIARAGAIAYARAVRRIEEGEQMPGGEGGLTEEDVAALPTIWPPRLEEIKRQRGHVRQFFTSTIMVQRAARRFIMRRNERSGTTSIAETRRRRDWEKLSRMLKRCGLQEYEETFQAEQLSFSRLDYITVDSLRLAGIPLGHAVDIIAEHRSSPGVGGGPAAGGLAGGRPTLAGGNSMLGMGVAGGGSQTPRTPRTPSSGSFRSASIQRVPTKSRDMAAPEASAPAPAPATLNGGLGPVASHSIAEHQ